MITKTIEGVIWHTDTPSVFVHNDEVAVHYHSGYWHIRTQRIGDLSELFVLRSAAMQRAKSHIGG